MLPQPPPNAPAPPPSEAALRSRRQWRWILVVGLVSIAPLLVLTAPMTIRSRKKPDQTEAVSNARQIGLALVEFENEFGSYPDPSTISKIRQTFPAGLNLGTKSSNDFFRQLIGGEFHSK